MFGGFIYNLAIIAILLSSPNTVIVKGVCTIIWLDRNVYSPVDLALLKPSPEHELCAIRIPST